MIHWYSIFTSLMTLVLLAAGALVTGTGSGLAVPDWPLSFGQFFPPMVGGVFFEHGHRMIAGSVGLLTLILALWLWKSEKRRWVIGLGMCALMVVFCQALLGGITVLLRLPLAVSVFHATLGQIFFCLTIVLVLVTSPGWGKAWETRRSPYFSLHLHSVLITFLFFVQLVLGALTRHLGAGIAIPDFPLSFGRLIPPFYSLGVMIHFAHRVGAFSLILLTVWFGIRVFLNHIKNASLVTWAGALICLICIQIFLGAITVWTARALAITTGHLVVGALCFATSVAISFQLLAKGKWVA